MAKRPPIGEHRNPIVVLTNLAAGVDCIVAARAVTRAQEGLPPAAIRAAYRSLYYPAQELHIARDRPREAADVVLHNG